MKHLYIILVIGIFIVPQLAYAQMTQEQANKILTWFYIFEIVFFTLCGLGTFYAMRIVLRRLSQQRNLDRKNRTINVVVTIAVIVLIFRFVDVPNFIMSIIEKSPTSFLH